MTIAQKGTFQGNIDSQLDASIENAEKQAKQAVKTDKPSLYKHIATTYIQWISIGLTAVGIIYKMFFADLIRERSSAKKKLTVQAMTKQVKSQSAASTDKSGKGSIVNSKSEIKIVGDLAKTGSIAQPTVIPELQLPDVPSLPVIDRIEVDTSSNDKKNLDDKMNNPTHQQMNLPVATVEVGNGSNLQNNIPPSIANTPDRFVNNSSNPLDPQVATSMFVVKGNGPTIKQQRISNSKNDFILFDGSSLSVREVTTQNFTRERIANLENTITEGKVIEAVLETAINSEMPGTVRAIVSKDAIGESGNKVIIPAGSRLYGTYSSNVSYSQTRVAIVWNKVMRPDGIVIQIDAQASDQFGRAGIEGDVDSKYMEMFQNGMLLSFITLGTSIALEKVAGVTGQTQTVGANTGTITTSNITPTNMAVQSIVTTAADIAKEMSKKLMQQVKPTISIPHGTLLKVMVNKNIVAAEYRRGVYAD